MNQQLRRYSGESYMMNIDIAVAPVALGKGTFIRLAVDGEEHWFDGKNNRLHRYVLCMPMTKWLLPYQERLFVWPGFLSALSREVNDRNFCLRFYGGSEAYQTFCREIALQQEQLEREQLQVSFSFAGAPDAIGTAEAMRELLSSMQDELLFSRDENKRANQLRRILKEPMLRLSDAGGDSVCRFWQIGNGEPNEIWLGYGLALDVQEGNGARFEKEYMKILERVGMENAHAIRCFMIHEDARSAEHAEEQLRAALRRRCVCVWSVQWCSSMEQAETELKAYLQDGCFEEMVLPAILEEGMKLVRRHFPEMDECDRVSECWAALCNLLLPENCE